MRAMGPPSQVEYSGPSEGFVRSMSEAPAGGPPPEELAQPRTANRQRSTAAPPSRERRSAPKTIEEYLTDGPLMEDPSQGRGDGQGSGLLHAAHLDAQVTGLDDHHRPLRLQVFLQEGDHLLGDALLQLRTLGVELEDAGELGEAQDAVARDVGDMGVAVEGYEVVGAHGVEGNLLLHHHVAVAFLVR